MNAIKTIFKREFLAYFRSPVAYVFLIVFLLLQMGLTWFITGFFESNNASLDGFFSVIPWVFLILIPAVGMRLWSEERRSGTLEILLTMPITTSQAVLAKFLAGWLFIILAIALTFPMIITILFLGDPDMGPIFSSYLGAILIAGCYLSICSMTSALSKNQVISFVLGLSLCLILVLIGWNTFNELLSTVLPVQWVDAIANFSFVTRFEPMIKGLISLKDLIFYFSLMAITLSLNVLILQRNA